MGQFFKFTFATIFGIFLFTILSFFLLIGIGAAASGKKTTKIESNSILKLDLNYSIPEKSNEDPFSDIDFQTFKPKKAVGLAEILKSIEHAKTDKNIAGIYLPLGITPNGFATLEAIRNKLIDFKTSGKFVYAYGVLVSQKSYYLATVADKLFLDAFDKYGIEVQEFHVGAFKSAIEPFIRSNMSEPNREQTTLLLGDLQQLMVKNISEARKIEPAFFQSVLDSLKATNSKDCKALGLVEEDIYYDQLLSKFMEKTGAKKIKDLEFVELEKYVSVLDDSKNDSKNRVAVVVLEGSIVDGEGGQGDIGGDKVAKLLRKLREDEKVKAIVLRVNSPGGSAVASDIMWREISLAKKEKPVVVSFGDVAASGGYYISCGADRIFAQPNTITGSIGVFGLIPNFQKLLTNQLGVTFDEVELSQHAVFGGGTKPLDAFERKVVQLEVERVYSDFKSRVAEGRNRPEEEIEKIAQGRVWTGTQGLERGLVDEIGSLDDAIAFAVKKAALKDHKVKFYPEEKSFAEQISESFAEMKTNWVKEQVGEHYQLLQTIKQLKSRSGVQCRMPMEVEGL
jgi:protease-4